MKNFIKYLLFAFVLCTVCTTEAQTLRNSYNSNIGKVESDGTVRDANNSRIGKIESDGTVRDANNSRIGSAAGVDRKTAAVLFFMTILQ